LLFSELLWHHLPASAGVGLSGLIPAVVPAWPARNSTRGSSSSSSGPRALPAVLLRSSQLLKSLDSDGPQRARSYLRPTARGKAGAAPRSATAAGTHQARPLLVHVGEACRRCPSCRPRSRRVPQRSVIACLDAAGRPRRPSAPSGLASRVVFFRNSVARAVGSGRDTSERLLILVRDLRPAARCRCRALPGNAAYAARLSFLFLRARRSR